MYTLRDLVVCGPVVVAPWLLRDAGAGWAVTLLISLCLYGVLRLVGTLTGLEQAARDRSAALRAERLAQTAVPRSDVRLPEGRDAGPKGS